MRDCTCKTAQTPEPAKHCAVHGSDSSRPAGEINRWYFRVEHPAADPARQAVTEATDEVAALSAELEAAGVRGGVCLDCGSAVLRGEHLRDDLEPCMGQHPRQQVVALKEELRSTRTDLVTADEHMRSLVGERDALRAENTQIREEVQAKLDRAKQVRGDLRAELAEVKAECDRWERDWEVEVDRCSVAVDYADRVEAELAAVTGHLRAAETAAGSSIFSSRPLACYIEDIKAERDAMRNKLTLTQRELKRVDYEYANQMNEVERMRPLAEAMVEDVFAQDYRERHPMYEEAIAFRAAQQERADVETFDRTPDERAAKLKRWGTQEATDA